MRHFSKLVALTLVVAASLWQVGCDKEATETASNYYTSLPFANGLVVNANPISLAQFKEANQFQAKIGEITNKLEKAGKSADISKVLTADEEALLAVKDPVIHYTLGRSGVWAFKDAQSLEVGLSTLTFLSSIGRYDYELPNALKELVEDENGLSPAEAVLFNKLGQVIVGDSLYTLEGSQAMVKNLKTGEESQITVLGKAENIGNQKVDGFSMGSATMPEVEDYKLANVRLTSCNAPAERRFLFVKKRFIRFALGLFSTYESVGEEYPRYSDDCKPLSGYTRSISVFGNARLTQTAYFSQATTDALGRVTGCTTHTRTASTRSDWQINQEWYTLGCTYTSKGESRILYKPSYEDEYELKLVTSYHY